MELSKLRALWPPLSDQYRGMLSMRLHEFLTCALWGLLLVEVEREVLDDERCHSLASLEMAQTRDAGLTR